MSVSVNVFGTGTSVARLTSTGSVNAAVKGSSAAAWTEPIRGWADTCNAHPTDFFYTGVCTSPLSSLWLMPAGSVHIVAIMACLWVNSFVGSLGHCRLDLNVIEETLKAQ